MNPLFTVAVDILYGPKWYLLMCQLTVMSHGGRIGSLCSTVMKRSSIERL